MRGIGLPVLFVALLGPLPGLLLPIPAAPSEDHLVAQADPGDVAPRLAHVAVPVANAAVSRGRADYEPGALRTPTAAGPASNAATRGSTRACVHGCRPGRAAVVSPIVRWCLGHATTNSVP